MTAQLALLFSTFFWFFSVFASPLVTRQYPKRTQNGLHVPIFRRESRGIQRRAGLTGQIGLGDFVDVTYSFLVTVGGTEMPLVLDTGSSDLWIASDACTTCTTNVPLFPQASFASAGWDVDLLYGDSLTGTHASGVIGTDEVTFAGVAIPNQYFAAINDTNTNVIDVGAAGIFGLGFALNSVIWNEVFAKNFDSSGAPSARRSLSSSNYATRFFPDLNSLISTRKRASTTESAAALTAAVLNSYPGEGPALTRMVTTNSLAAPMFTITLQRDTLDIGGNEGILSIGELPAGVEESALTWAPIRGYPGALNAPADSPNEDYPIAWELFLDDVYLDGVRLPRSNLSSSSIALSALIDTGNSLLRGPADVVSAINAQLGNTFACATPHIMEFSIGGKMFPVDPRDFVTQAFDGELQDCTANVVETDSPVAGQGYQYSWSLGDPFIKGVLAAFYYGNITYPSVDPPRIGLLSTVPSNAGTLLQGALTAAQAQNGGNEFSTSNAAPTGVPVSFSTTSGVPAAPVGKVTDGNSNGARRQGRVGWEGEWVLAMALVGGLVGLL
ncbi:aspartic peptidase domain-containing protein [Mycena maculata]|uniref:Aspartic peptidase domain-containing protein n=1 Tax=Mycena maculata TaxID=230809 RepID=A0AAD7HP36_9AGAR|nr:aspartic peptidase domain-containing protein [Mycena maculata]